MTTIIPDFVRTKFHFDNYCIKRDIARRKRHIKPVIYTKLSILFFIKCVPHQIPAIYFSKLDFLSCISMFQVIVCVNETFVKIRSWLPFGVDAMRNRLMVVFSRICINHKRRSISKVYDVTIAMLKSHISRWEVGASLEIIYLCGVLNHV